MLLIIDWGDDFSLASVACSVAAPESVDQARRLGIVRQYGRLLFNCEE
jgi:hypothetical protein